MMSMKLRLLSQILATCFVIFLFVCPLLAGVDGDADTNPDSPTPILLSEENSTRALADTESFFSRPNLTKLPSRAYEPDSNVVLFATNLDLMPGEDAGAFRMYVQDAGGQKYRFPVVNIQPLQNQPWIYALTVSIKDDPGFWESVRSDGDVLIGVEWRGLLSNRVRLGIGEMGGGIKDDEGAVPTPASAFPSPPAVEENQDFDGTANSNAGNVSSPNYVGYRFSADRMRFLEQATFGPTPMLDQRIRRIGLRVWLNEQFNEPYPTIPYPDLVLQPTNVPSTCDSTCQRDYYTMYLPQRWLFQEAFYGNAQLRHRIAWALSQLWVISGVDTQQASYMVTYHKILAKHSFGNYRNLMQEMTLNPGMGNYLDMVRSTKTSANENYAREILQLFSVGLFMLNQDGTLQRDGQGNPIPTYDQNTVNNFTKVFTGWNFCNTAATCPGFVTGTVNYTDPMVLNQTNHDVTAKTLLSYPNAVNLNIAANTNGTTELNQALDNIFNHPNLGPFVGRFLIQQLVTSDPTPAYVSRVAAAFNNNGSGVRGDMQAVVKAILLDPEARGSVKTDPNYGKLREPVLYATNLLRTFGVTTAAGTGQSDGYINPNTTTMGQNVFNSPTVFNYYSPEYIVPGTALNGPEFGIMTTGTTIARANFINTMAFSRIAAGGNAPTGTALNLAEMQALATSDTTGNQLMDALNQKMMHGTMSAQMRSTILTAVLAVASNNPLQRVQQAIYLVATSSQYQVQR